MHDIHTTELNNTDSKLALYAQLLGHSFKTAPYIGLIKSCKVRNSLTRFGISGHNLPVETLRYFWIILEQEQEQEQQQEQRSFPNTYVQ